MYLLEKQIDKSSDAIYTLDMNQHEVISRGNLPYAKFLF